LKESHSKKTLLGIISPKLDLFFSKWEISIHGRIQNKLKKNFNLFEIQDSRNQQITIKQSVGKKEGKITKCKDFYLLKFPIDSLDIQNSIFISFLIIHLIENEYNKKFE
jgi:hypothetical protein